MKIYKDKDGDEYALPSSLSKFKLQMYLHLSKWKKLNINSKRGKYIYKEKEYFYDTILDENDWKYLPHIYPNIKVNYEEYFSKYPFRLHLHFYHMVSSQVANINLFLPILHHPQCNNILSQLKPDFKKLVKSNFFEGETDDGYRLEYWSGNSISNKGVLGDHNSQSGTDSDIAITYFNNNDELCLWLIEHKLTEEEFTECGGFKSEGRNKSKHLCEKSFSEIINDKHICYYHDIRKSEYWNITEEHQSFFTNANTHTSCPFKGGMNQLWRNQLMGLALEKTGKYKHVYFSVVHHPENDALSESMNEYKKLIANNKKFFHFTSRDVINAAEKIGDSAIDEWVSWYKGLYNV
jgi:hypothetical protein